MDAQGCGLSPRVAPAPTEPWPKQGTSLHLRPLFSETRDFNSFSSKSWMPVASCKFHPLSKAFPDHLIIAARERGILTGVIYWGRRLQREAGWSTGKAQEK